MELKEYQRFWDHASPRMKDRLDAIKLCLLEHWLPRTPELALSDITEGGDEEFRLTLDLRRGDTVVLVMDFVLTDSCVHEGSAGILDQGVGIKLEIIGYNALALGGYAPFNYTQNAFTSDIEELVRRIESLDTDDFCTYLMTQAWTNPTLQKELATAD